jgi:uncharacterized protein (TIGR02246 family)
MRARSTYLAAAAVLLWACGGQPAADSATKSAEPAVDVAAVKQTIEDANARFLDALSKADVSTAAANYADDAILMMPNAPAWQGKQAIVDGFTGFLKEYKLSNGKPTTTDVQVAGDLAVETGTFEWTLTPKSGAAMTDKGKYLTVWKKQADGTWKIIRDINNSDLPPAGGH